jgi:hypothetical protein
MNGRKSGCGKCKDNGGKRKTLLTSTVLLKEHLQGVEAPFLITTIIGWYYFMTEVACDGDILRSVCRHRI